MSTEKLSIDKRQETAEKTRKLRRQHFSRLSSTTRRHLLALLLFHPNRILLSKRIQVSVASIDRVLRGHTVQSANLDSIKLYRHLEIMAGEEMDPDKRKLMDAVLRAFNRNYTPHHLRKRLSVDMADYLELNPDAPRDQVIREFAKYGQSQANMAYKRLLDGVSRLHILMHNFMTHHPDATSDQILHRFKHLPKTLVMEALSEYEP